MSQVIHISEKSASLLAQQAAAQGMSIEEWIEELAVEMALRTATAHQAKIRAAVDGILELQKEVKPDPEGWTLRDYVNHGRR